MATCHTKNRNGTKIKSPEVLDALNKLHFTQDNLDGEGKALVLLYR
jgi:hypothetical protein